MLFEIHSPFNAVAAFVAARASMKAALPRRDESNQRIRTCFYLQLLAVFV